MPPVSVVMPAFNAAATVDVALRSIREQTLGDIEIIIVDDGSTDATGRIIGAQAAADPRIRMISWANNRGVVEAMNRGVAESTGELVARMDSDDYAYRERLARQAECFDMNPDIAVCATGIRIVGGGDGYSRFEGWVNSLQSHEAMARERFVETPVVNPTVMFRRSAWEAVGGVRKLPWAEDYDLWLRMFGAGYRFAKLPEVLLDWRDSPGRLTRRDASYSHRAFLEAKAYHFARIPDAMARGVRVCGAGPIGKRFARLLLRRGIKVAAFYEVSERRIGEQIAGVPVCDQRALARAGGEFLVGAVGRPGARPLLRELAAREGYTEGHDFWLVA